MQISVECAGPQQHTGESRWLYIAWVLKIELLLLMPFTKCNASTKHDTIRNGIRKNTSISGTMRCTNTRLPPVHCWGPHIPFSTCPSTPTHTHTCPPTHTHKCTHTCPPIPTYTCTHIPVHTHPHTHVHVPVHQHVLHLQVVDEHWTSQLDIINGLLEGKTLQWMMQSSDLLRGNSCNEWCNRNQVISWGETPAMNVTNLQLVIHTNISDYWGVAFPFQHFRGY